MTVAFLARNVGQLDSAHMMSAEQIMRESGLNLGNLAFWYAARAMIEDDIVLVDWSTKASSIPKEIKAFIIPAANFLNPTADLTSLAALVRDVDKPVLLWGIGAQSETESEIPVLQDSVIDFLTETSIRTDHICVRGEYSAKVCRHYGIENVKVLGCPSILINRDKKLGVKIQQKLENVSIRNTAVHAACVKDSLTSVERELVKLIKLNTGSSYIMQRPPELIKLCYSEPLNTEEKEYVNKCIRFFAFEGLADLEKFIKTVGYVPVGVESWLSYLRPFSCAVNTRIHGTILSLMAGIPAVCICHDTRTRELAQLMKIPHVSTKQFIELRFDLRAVFRQTNFDGAVFDNSRLKIAAEYRNMIISNDLLPSQHLVDLASNADQEAAPN